jgi:hypothetical protein
MGGFLSVSNVLIKDLLARTGIGVNGIRRESWFGILWPDVEIRRPWGEKDEDEDEDEDETESDD